MSTKGPMTDTTTLIEALKAAGHEEQADHLRDTEFARQLRDAGHDDVASALEQKRAAPAGASAQPEPEPTENERLLAEIKKLNADQWSSSGSSDD